MPPHGAVGFHAYRELGRHLRTRSLARGLQVYRRNPDRIPLPTLEVSHVLPRASHSMTCIDFETFACVVQDRGEIGKLFALYLRQWACIEAGTTPPNDGDTE